MKKGIFITIEGNEGAGKSTIAKHIENFFNSKNINVIRTREPGGNDIAEDFRKIILNYELDPITEALTFAASRREHLKDVIMPNLKNNNVVICDRYLDSSIAYQGHARGVGIEKVLAINSFALENNLPDLTLILDLDPKVGLKRITNEKTREINRLDKESIEFHNKCREGFQKLKKLFPKRKIIFIDATKNEEEVKNNVLEIIKKEFSLC